MRSKFCALLAFTLAVGLCSVASAVPPKKAPVEKKPVAEAAFDKLDANKDGKLTVDEFCGEKTGKAKEAAEKMFKKFDTDNSGDVSLDEFKAKGRKPKESK